MGQPFSKRLYRRVRQSLAIPARLYRQYYLGATLPKLVEQARQKWRGESIDSFRELRQSTLSYVASNHQPELSVGAYSYVPGGPPLLYASCYAVLTRHLWRDLDYLSLTERREWITYIQKYQTDDGLFRDSLIDCPQAESRDWWGWRHLTLHAIMALTCLGAIARKRFRIIDSFKDQDLIIKWFDHQDWCRDPATTSNKVQNYLTILQYARDFQGESWAGKSLEVCFLWLDEHQDKETGLWGKVVDSPVSLSLCVQTGYHIWLLYFYDNRPIKYVERIIDSCLSTQNRLGGFGVLLNSSACEDIDSIDPLVRLSSMTNYRKEEIHSTIEDAIPWILTNLNEDGGFVFRRLEPFVYGHKLMSSEKDESAMFPTWFRTLSLAYIGKHLQDSSLGEFDWQFIRSPGLQF